MSETIAYLEGVQKTYGFRAALAGVSITIPTGITGLLGPNGSGKSTLIKAILGLVRVDAGTGRVLQFSWPQQTRLLRDRVGYLPEDDCYIHGLQGIQSIQMMARLSGLYRKEALRRAHEVADFSDIGQERYRTVETYSTGMRQKLKFAQSLVHDPDLIILDEPTTGLDPSQRENLLDRVNLLAKEKGKSVLLSTHILHDVQRVCDQVIILVKGKVCLADSLARLQQPSQAQLSVSVVDNALALQTALQNRGLESHLTGPTELRISGDETQVQQVWQAGRESQVLIQKIEPARNSLEQTFLDAVRE